MKRTWYRFEEVRAQADQAGVAKVYIYGDIGRYFPDDDAVTARQFVADLNALPASTQAIEVHLNSLGGDVDQGQTIATALNDQKARGRRVTTIVDGIAASAATLPFMSGESRRLADNALLFLHNPHAATIGNAEVHRKTAEDLDVIRGAMLACYRWGVTPEQLADDALIAMLDAETWLEPARAVELGFATEILTGATMAAAAQIEPGRAFAKLTIPPRYQPRVAAFLRPMPSAAAALDVIRACQDARAPELAEGLIAAGATLDQVKAQTLRAKTIRGLCSLGKVDVLADGYIASQMPLEHVRAHLTTITAMLDCVEIDGSLLPDSDAPARPRGVRISPVDVYARRNATTKE
jgi:ATP-dependent protease ClpP protease subunit